MIWFNPHFTTPCARKLPADCGMSIPSWGKPQEFPNDVVHVEVTRPKSPLQVQEMNCDNFHPHPKFWWLNFPPKYWVVTVKSRILYTSLLLWKPSIPTPEIWWKIIPVPHIPLALGKAASPRSSRHALPSGGLQHTKKITSEHSSTALLTPA